MSERTSTENFKNEASRRFHNFFYSKIKDREIDGRKFFKDFGISYSNPMQFFSGLRYGDRSVTIDHLEIANNKYDVRPNYMFGISELASNTGDFLFDKPDPVFAKGDRNSVGEKLRSILEKHKVNIGQ